jgi:nucleotide-binding universal stress UspA family protein
VYPDPFVHLNRAIEAVLGVAVWAAVLVLSIAGAMLAFAALRSRLASGSATNTGAGRADVDLDAVGERPGPIVVGVAEAADGAITTAGRIAGRLGRKLVLVHATADPPTFPYGDQRLREIERRQATINAAPLLRRAARMVPRDVAVERLVVFGQADKAIARAARDRGAALLVVGRRPRRGLLAGLARSTAARLQAVVQSPVMSVSPASSRVRTRTSTPARAAYAPW